MQISTKAYLSSVFIGLMLLGLNGIAQQSLYAGFYNVENLFDTIDDPHHNDSEYLPSSEKKWDTKKYRSKLENLADIISSMNKEQGPDILGLCEVENNVVLQDLVKQRKLIPAHYGILHFESPDERGIDNALLYKLARIKPVKTLKYKIVYPSHRSGTRDILVAQLRIDNTSDLAVLVIHAPSRLGGDKSETKRMLVASVMRHIADSITHANTHMPVLIMGDFNDEPCDNSIDAVLGAPCNGKGTYYNPMAEISKNGKGTVSYKGKWMVFDQIICGGAMHRAATNESTWRIDEAGIFDDPRLIKSDKKGHASPFRTYNGKKYLNGYSDHLPVYLKMHH